MQTQNINTAHSLYRLYETLSDETQQLFLRELLEKQRNKIELSLKQNRSQQEKKLPENRFADICGILTADNSVSLEEMEEAIALQGLERFNDCN